MNDDRLSQLYRRHAGRARPSGEHVSLEALLAIAEGPANSVDRNSTLDHVMACTHCQAELELLRAVVDGTAPTPIDQTTTATKPGGRRRLQWWPPGPALATAAVLTLLLGSALIWSRFLNQGEITRGDNQAIALIAPSGDTRLPVTLAWRPAPDPLEYRVEVVNEDGGVVHTASTRDTISAVTPNLLERGRTYRWWVTAVSPDGARVTAEPLTFTAR